MYMPIYMAEVTEKHGFFKIKLTSHRSNENSYLKLLLEIIN